ncbi:MAG: fluoride efflux transporter CrcB [Pseudomonadota bacterium]
MIEKVLAVALGGAIGAAGRFAVGVLLTRPPGGFPLATFTVNVVGSFAIGVLAVVLMERAGAFARWAPFLITGVLGGFTTFSAFALDSLFLIERGRIGTALAYMFASTGLSILAVWAGLVLARRFLA